MSAQIQAKNNSSLLEVTQHNRGLINPFTDKTAFTQQFHDLLDFRHIGQQEFLLRISYFILKVPSVKAPNRRKALQTFSVKQARKRRISQLERDEQLVISAMKKKLQFSLKTGKPIIKPEEQLLEYPLSLCDSEGNANKGLQTHCIPDTRSLPHKCLQLPFHQDGRPNVY